MKKSTFLVLFLVCMACATTAPMETYRPAGDSGNLWQITGEYNEFTSMLIIKINGEVAINDRLPIFSSAGEVSGSYKAHPVSANCTLVKKMFSKYMQCIVFVDNERAATLQF